MSLQHLFLVLDFIAFRSNASVQINVVLDLRMSTLTPELDKVVGCQEAICGLFNNFEEGHKVLINAN